MPGSRSFVYSMSLALATSALVALPVAANAVTPPPIPNTARPESVQRQMQLGERPEISNKQIITVQEQGGKELKGGVSFVLKSVQFEDGKQLKSEELKQLYQDRIGKNVTLNELNSVANNITAYYRNKGFILTRAVVPPQRIDNGVVKIRIIEGFVSDVQLKGDVGSKDSVLYSYAEKIKAAKPLDAKTLEHYLLLMEDLPGVEARAVLQPSPTTPGASQIIVNIKRNVLEGSTVLVNNRGTRFLGPVQAMAVVSGSNLLGQDEQTSVRVLNTPFYYDQLRYVGARHEEQLGAYGTKLILDGSFVVTKPGFNLEDFDVEGHNYVLDAQLTHPIIRSRRTNWLVNTDFSVQRSNLSVLGDNFYLDKVRVLTAGSSYDFIDETNAINRMEANISKGFSWGTGNNGLGHSRANGESSFWKATANVTRLQPIYNSWTLSTAVEGQYSLDPLYAGQEYALGGQRFGSAYDPAEISGDSGLAGRVELQYNGTTEGKYMPSYQVYGFYDIGKVWNRDIVAASEAKGASLASTGIGTRFNVTESVTGDLEFNFPLTRKVAAYGADGDAPHLYFNLQYRY